MEKLSREFRSNENDCVKKAPFETECVVYINYLSDALTLHFSDGSHTLKLWGTDSHSNDLGEIWEQGIYGFKIATHYFNLKKKKKKNPAMSGRSVISIEQFPG